MFDTPIDVEQIAGVVICVESPQDRTSAASPANPSGADAADANDAQSPEDHDDVQAA